MLDDKALRTKISICGINPSVGRTICLGVFAESFVDLVYNEKENRYDVTLKFNIDIMNEKEKKKLKERITAFEKNKAYKNVFKVVDTFNKVEL